MGVKLEHGVVYEFMLNGEKYIMDISTLEGEDSIVISAKTEEDKHFAFNGKEVISYGVKAGAIDSD